MNAATILKELEALGQESIKKVLLKHGIQEPLFGVKVEFLKKIQKRIKKDYQLALDLYNTGNYDARYLAGLIADDQQMTKKDLQHWADNASSAALCSYTVAWVAAESQHGWEMGRKWIDSKKSHVAICGWGTLGSYVSITPDEDLDLPELKKLLSRIQKTIHGQPERVRYAMNGFLLCVGVYVSPLTDDVLKAGERIGKVEVDVGDTSCKVPSIPEYIEKVKKRGSLGKKRKTAKC